MKFVIISLLVLASCVKIEPVQVSRLTLTLNRIERHPRYQNDDYWAVWVDKRGIEYKEKLQDTLGLWIGKSYVQMLRR